MIVKQHCKNTAFDYTNFFIGKCHTPDGALIAIRGQLMHVQSDVKLAKAQEIGHQIKLIEANEILNSSDSTKVEKLNAEKTILETENALEMFVKNVEGAENELNNLKKLEQELIPLCKYADLPFIEAQELIQREEWEGELKARAENMMLSQMTGIPWDHMETMRSHPDFTKSILPHIVGFKAKLNQLSNLGPEDTSKKLSLIIDDNVKLLTD